VTRNLHHHCRRARVILAAMAAALMVVLAGCGSAPAGHPAPKVTVTVTKTATKTRTVTKTRAVPGPTITVKVPVPGPTVYRDGYRYVSEDPAWNRAGNLWNAYIRLARGGPAGDLGLWQALCPGVPEPAN
jgi:hypothetical protein